MKSAFSKRGPCLAGPCPQYAAYGVLIISEYGNHKQNIVKSSIGPKIFTSLHILRQEKAG